MTRLYIPILLMALTTLFGCNYDQLDPEVVCADNLELVISKVSDATCGEADGQIEVEVRGVEDELQLSLDGVNFQTESVFPGLAAGSYQITARSGNCITSTAAEIRNANGLNIIVSTQNSSCDTATGAIEVASENAAGLVQYRLDQGAFQSESRFTRLDIGSYELLVKDESGCEISSKVEVKGEISFSNIGPIIKNNCAISGCHGGNIAPDFRNLDNILANAQRIKTRTGNGSMPPTQPLSEADVAKIACWVDSGAEKE